MEIHRQRILDQFTRQAEPFASSPGIRAPETLQLIMSLTNACSTDTSLDVACGPGLMVCAFAKVVRHATGIDITPAMLGRARQEAEANDLRNVSWHLGDVAALPYADGSFEVVTSRYAFHHIVDAFAVLCEMRRVCAIGGRIALIDSSPTSEKADAFNRMEKLRDPSHVRAMPIGELKDLFRRAGLSEPQTTLYRLRGDLDGLLSRSFPNPGDDLKIRELFESSLAADSLDMDVQRVDGRIHYGHPTAILVSTR
jgi:SAM-dependent methyltransferase